MADYLSRHPSPYDGNVVKAEEMFNKWFTINVIDGLTPTLSKAKRTNVAKPIRSQNGEKELNTQVLKVHAPVHKLCQSKHVDKLQESEKNGGTARFSKFKNEQSVCPSELRIGQDDSESH